MRPVLVLLIAAPALLGGCSTEQPRQASFPADPVVAGALLDQLMVDPDLARQNPRNAALTGGGPAEAPIPPDDRSSETIAQARAEAARMGGGHAPGPQPGNFPPAGETAMQSATAALAGIPAAKACAGSPGYGFIWAARMPARVPIYPRGHVQEAAGTDEGGCHVRAVHFRSPVPVGDVVDFYWNRARAAGMKPQHRKAGPDQVVTAGTGKTGFTVWVRSRHGLTEADLVTLGP